MINFVNNYTAFFISLTVIMALSCLFIYNVWKDVGISVIATILKFSFFILYFTVLCYHNPIVLADDLEYFNESLLVYKQGTSLSFFFSKEGFVTMGAIAQGQHFGYYIYNVIAMHLFGASYYAPVLMNIFFSVLAAVFLYKILVLVKAGKKFSKFAFLLFLLHWDIMSWSSFMNLKDTFVLFLTLAALYNIIKLKTEGFSTMNFIYFIVILLVFQLIRFYFSYFLLVTALLFLLLSYVYKIKSIWKKLFLQVAILVIMPVGFYVVVLKLFSVKLATLGPTSNIVLGVVRYLLTPIPFNIDSDYWFISIATFLHWLFIPLALYGLYIFIKQYFYTLIPFLIITILLTVFYGSFTELQGPRHRIPLIGFFTIIQGLGLWNFIMLIVAIRKRKSLTV